MGYRIPGMKQGDERIPRKAATPEADVRRGILIYMRARGHEIHKTPVQGAYSSLAKCRIKDPYLYRGWPDLSGFICVDRDPVRMVFIEVKAPKDSKHRYAQRYFQWCCVVAGGPQYILAKSTDDVIKELALWEKGERPETAVTARDWMTGDGSQTFYYERAQRREEGLL